MKGSGKGKGKLASVAGGGGQVEGFTGEEVERLLEGLLRVINVQTNVINSLAGAVSVMPPGEGGSGGGEEGGAEGGGAEGGGEDDEEDGEGEEEESEGEEEEEGGGAGSRAGKVGK